MHTIKLRAWHKSLKIMCDIKNITLGEHGWVTPIIPKELTHIHWDEERWSFGQIELMQWTGFKDARDIEIYDGDIICCAYSDPCGASCSNYFKVYYDIAYGTWMAKFISSVDNTPDYLVELFDHCQLDALTVQGSIYENPELLETK